MSESELVPENPGSDTRPGTSREGIAIIGMACRFPQAPNLDTYWQNILGKVNAITDPPPGTWDPDVYYEPGSTDSDKVYCKQGGYLGSLINFDPLDHGIPPVQVQGEPDQWLALQVAREAMADAGYAELQEATPKADRHHPRAWRNAEIVARRSRSSTSLSSPRRLKS